MRFDSSYQSAADSRKITLAKLIPSRKQVAMDPDESPRLDEHREPTQAKHLNWPPAFAPSWRFQGAADARNVSMPA
jgi:hypothetical protein